MRSADLVADWNAAFVGVLNLMSNSGIHRGWSIADIERLIVPPMRLGQCFVMRHGDHIIGFASYALLTEEAEVGYIDGTRKIHPTDWNAGDRLWWIDAIAPFGHARHLPRHLKALLRERGLADREIRFRRTYTTNRPRRYARATT